MNSCCNPYPRLSIPFPLDPTGRIPAKTVIEVFLDISVLVRLNAIYIRPRAPGGAVWRAKIRGTRTPELPETVNTGYGLGSATKWRKFRHQGFLTMTHRNGARTRALSASFWQFYGGKMEDVDFVAVRCAEMERGINFNVSRKCWGISCIFGAWFYSVIWKIGQIRAPVWNV